MPTLTVTGDQGFNELRYNNTNFDVFDFTGAILRVNKYQPDYPFYISGSQQSNVEVFGGRHIGLLDPTIPRSKANPGNLYVDFNSAAFFVASGPSVHFHDWVFGAQGDNSGHVWDAMRIVGGSNHLVENVEVWGWRDDVIESDGVSSGTLTVRDCLFDGGFTGISATGSQPNRTINLTRLVMSCTDRFPNDDPSDLRTGPMFKVDSSQSISNRPTWVVNDSVFAFIGLPTETSRIEAAFSKWSGTGNTMCFIQSPFTGEGGALPGSFPTIPAGMQVLEGATAKNFYDAAVASYLGGTVPGPEPVGTYSEKTASINPTTGLLTITTNRARNTPVTVGAGNAAGRGTRAINFEVA